MSEDPVKPKVSIIIPVYNGSNYIKEAIDSALSQTYRNIEIIVVNDGSADDNKTENIALSYGDKIRYFSKNNGGVATALNYGIGKMTGDYMSWLSHDDMYLPHKIERQIDYLQNIKSVTTILYSDFEIFNVETGRSQVCVTSAVSPANNMLDTLYLLFAGTIHGCTLLLPRRCFEEVGLFDETLKTVQDYDLWFKLLKARYDFRHIEGPLIITRHHKGQGTLSMAEIHQQEVERLYIWAFDEFYESFKRFSFEQVASFVILLINKMLTKAPDHIIKRWPENQARRDSLLRYVQNQKKHGILGPLAGKFAPYPLLMKFASAGHTAFATICRSFEKK
jgi:glycosyltransferase involved in cell wall biosynthesis